MATKQIAPEPREELTCAKCGEQNSPGRNACNRCGAHLYVICKSCGHGTPRTFRRCRDCGHSLHRSRFKRILARLEIKRLKIKPLHLLLLATVVPIAFKLILIFLGTMDSSPPPE